MRISLLIAAVVAATLFVKPVQAAITFVPDDLSIGDTYHVAFVTGGSFPNGSFPATSTEIEDYNDFVQSEAELPGAETENWEVSWFAIGSTSAVSAKENIRVTDAPLYLLNGSRIADDGDDLWDGTIDTAISTTQFGAFINTGAWTGTSIDGTASSRPLGASDVTFGNSTFVGNGWVNAAFQGKSVPVPMYAVSQELTVIPEPSALAFLGIGALSMAGRRRKRLA